MQAGNYKNKLKVIKFKMIENNNNNNNNNKLNALLLKPRRKFLCEV